MGFLKVCFWWLLHSPLLIMMMGSICFGFSCFMSVFASLKVLVLGHRTVAFGPIALLQSTVYNRPSLQLQNILICKSTLFLKCNDFLSVQRIFSSTLYLNLNMVVKGKKENGSVFYLTSQNGH